MLPLTEGDDYHYSLWLKNEFIDFCKISNEKIDEYINNNGDIDFIDNYNFIRSPEFNILTPNFVITVLKKHRLFRIAMLDEDKILENIFSKLERSNPKFYNMAIFNFLVEKFRLHKCYDEEQLSIFCNTDYHISKFRSDLFDLLKYEAILAYKNKRNLSKIQEEIPIIKNKNVLYSHKKILIKGS